MHVIDIPVTFTILLGRPWFRVAKLKQDWDKDEIIIKKGSKTVKVIMSEKAVLAKEIKPMYAQAINLASEVSDDEEEDFLKANPTVVPVFEVDVIDIMDRY